MGYSWAAKWLIAEMALTGSRGRYGIRVRWTCMLTFLGFSPHWLAPTLLAFLWASGFSFVWAHGTVAVIPRLVLVRGIDRVDSG